MRDGTGDWLAIVYRPGLEVGRGEGRGAAPTVVVRQNPEIAALPAGTRRRVRVTVVPTEPGLGWRLYLESLGVASGSEGRGARVWWRLEPGTWQPLETRECVAEGRGRVRVDVHVRAVEGAGPIPRFRFVADPV